MSENLQRRTLFTIMMQVPAYFSMVGIATTILEIIYEVCFYLRYRKFHYLFIVDEAEMDTGKGCYLPSAYYKIVRCLKTTKSLLKTFENSVFIDIGCGSSRVLFAAALKGYRHLAGIELSKSLADLSDQNLKANLPKGVNYQILNCDAQDVNFNDLIEGFQGQIDSLVLFIGGAYLEDLKAFFTELNRSCEKDIYIINLGPQKNKSTFEESGYSIVFEEIRERPPWVQNFVKASGAFKYSYNKPFGYRVYKNI